MQLILDKLDERRNQLHKEVDEYYFVKSKRNILIDIIGTLKEEKSYREILNDLTFLKESLSLIYESSEATKYDEIIKMILMGLIKCENSKKVDPVFFEDFQKKLAVVTGYLEKDLVQIKTHLYGVSITKKRNELNNIERVLKIYQIKAKCSEKSLKQIYDLLNNLDLDEESIISFLEKMRLKTSQLPTDNSDVLKVLNYCFPHIENVLLTFDERSLMNRDLYKYNNIRNEKDFVEALCCLNEIDNVKIKQASICYILINLKKRYMDNKVILYDKDFFFEEESKREIIEECQKIIIFYEEAYAMYCAMKVVKSEKDSNNKTRFAFARNGGSTYFEKDLKKMETEIFESVKDLLDDMISSSELVILKKLVGSNNDLYEFKYDKLNNQLRILGYFLPNNVFLITGLMRKKDFANEKAYKRFDERVVTRNSDISVLLESYEDDLGRIFDYIEENKRKGTRK